MIDADHDTADAAHDLIRLLAGAQKVAVRALLDLPAAHVIGWLMATNGEPVAAITSGGARSAVVHGHMDPDVVLDLLMESGAIRPVTEDT